MNETCRREPINVRADVDTIIDRLSRAYDRPHYSPSLRPVDELVSTILSQNTSDVNTARAFASLQGRFATWADVRDTSTGEVIDAIRAGGLANQKGPRIQRVLEQLLEGDDQDGNDHLQQRLQELGLRDGMACLTDLPGVGPKTAACVLLFAVGLPALPVDTHVHRVARRLGLIDPDTSADAAHEVLGDLVEPDDAYVFHVLLIRHGRRICRARNPACEACILADICQYRQQQLFDQCSTESQ